MIKLGDLTLGDKNMEITDGTVVLKNSKVMVESENGNLTEIVPPASEDEVVINSCFSTEELVQNFMFGIDLSDQQGNPFPKALLVAYLNSAISWVEALFDICLSEVEVTAEPHDYERSDYTNWGYMQLWKRPVQKVKALRLMYGNRPSFEIPLDWIKVDKTSGKVQMFPSSGSVSNMIIGTTGVVYGIFNRWDYAPQMWEIDYVAGMTQADIPPMLKELIYKKTTIGILQVWGDLILGAGIASSSISIDGLSQSIGTTQSAMYGGASARCEEYRKDIELLIPVLRQKYAGIRMVVV